MSTTASKATERVVLVFVVLLLAATILSVAGLALMLYWPATVALTGRFLSWFMKAPTAIYMIAFPLIVFIVYRPSLGFRRSVLFLLWASGVGLAAELIGTTTGWPFGPYAYTDFLNPKILGHVPILIPLSWYAIAVLAYDLSRGPWGNQVRIALAAFYMVCWDVALDPAMAAGFPVWTWYADGPFYGMPLLNLAGWFVIGVIIIAGFERMGGMIQINRTWAIRLWLLSSLLPLGLSAVRQMWPAVLIGTASVSLPLIALWLIKFRRTPVPAGAVTP